MVVKSATKKKLMDRGIGEQLAHILADERKWNDLMKLSPREFGEIADRTIGAATIIWLKIGGLEVRFVEEDPDIIHLHPKFMAIDDTEPIFSYNFKTGVVFFEGDDDHFRGLGSLFGNSNIFDWFSPHTAGSAAFDFANVPEATEKQREQLRSLLNMGVMENIMGIIERKTYLLSGFRASINRMDIVNFLISENPSLKPESSGSYSEPVVWDGLESLFG